LIRCATTFTAEFATDCTRYRLTLAVSVFAVNVPSGDEPPFDDTVPYTVINALEELS